MFRLLLIKCNDPLSKKKYSKNLKITAVCELKITPRYKYKERFESFQYMVDFYLKLYKETLLKQALECKILV